MKMYKRVIWFLIFTIIAIAIYFFGFTDSYKTSLKAKVKYIEGDYKEANKLAKEAFDKDPYNRMAIGVLAQSKISVEFIDYIEYAKKYLKKIEALTKKNNFSNRDKIKIKVICDVMIGRYKKLNATVMTDKDLKKEASRYYKRFKSIYEELFKKQA